MTRWCWRSDTERWLSIAHTQPALNTVTVHDENEYEDLLGLWSDLESGLGILLGSPLSVQEFEQRIWQYDRWMQNLVQRDADLGLYLLFQLATNSSTGYSASHSLVCAVLCHLLAQELKDRLALQSEPLSEAQSEIVHRHGVQGGLILSNSLHIRDPLWIEIVSSHHEEYTERTELSQMTPRQRLVRILHVVDRYGAMISPRKSREGRSATESVRTVMTGANAYNDEVGHAIVRAVGLCPPGTYVRLEDKSLAIVIRRSVRSNQPHVAIVTNAEGQPLSQPRLHSTMNGRPAIQAALATSVVRLRLNHHLVLQLGSRAAARRTA
jgi:hypothetical protein